MDSSRGERGARWFFAKQLVLLLITIALVAFCTIPLVKAIKAALNPAELEANLSEAKLEAEGLQIKLEATRSKMLMGAGQDEAQEKLKEQVEELKRQLEMKELENKHLQNEIVMARLIAELVKTKSSPAETKVVDTSQKTDKQAETGQKGEQLAQTSEKIDKLVTETGQKVDKLVATGKNVAELVAKIFGGLASVFTGATFVVSWVRKRRTHTAGAPPQSTPEVASK